MPPLHILSASCLVTNDKNEILLIKSPRRGWEMPGGQVENGETITDAAIREVKEEAGVNVEITKYCGAFQNTNHSIVNHLFRAEYVSGSLTTSEESLEVGFFSYEQVMQQVTWGNFKTRINLCLDDTQHPFMVSFEEK
ncbi:NUDIX hydrolase [Staphylococcus simulans]|uniref:NUDIX hydrolase n=1 Tax=Staphylococcus simulans TaxID=1286 RepID=UPI000D041B39|nr:NUDIX hydrolase [Staphylococcus simulans]